MTTPTAGRPGGEHRVLEPPGAVPLEATRLDAIADLWDGELRLDLEAVVLTAHSHRRWVERLDEDPVRLAAAMTESVAERGGLAGDVAGDAVVVGTIDAVGRAHPHPVEAGERVAVGVPAAVLPLFAVPQEGWDGGRIVPVRGHAIVPASAPTVPVDELPAAFAAVLSATADVPAGLAPGHRLVVLGVDRPEGAVAVVAASSQLRHVTALVATLSQARLARALGADETAVVTPSEPVDSADHVLARASGRPDLVVLADPGPVALAARLAPVVQVLTDPDLAPTTAASLVRHARALGRGMAVHAGRIPTTDRGQALRSLLRDHAVLASTLRWQAGLGTLPTVPTDDDPEPR